MRNNKIENTKTLEIVGLSLYVVLYIVSITKVFWVIPGPSDALRYLGPLIESNWGHFAYFDGISLAIGLQTFVSLLPVPGFIAGMAYIGFINVCLIVLSMSIAWRKSGFWAALMVAIISTSSFVFLEEGTRITRDQTEALFSLGAFLLFLIAIKENSRKGRNLLLASGVLIAFALFSKLSAFSTFGLIALYLFGYRKNIKAKYFFFGIGIGSIITLLAYAIMFGIPTLIETVRFFFSTELNIYFVTVQANRLEQYLDLVLSLEMFPLVALLMIPTAYKDKASRDYLFLAWASIVFLVAMIAITPRGLAPDQRYLILAYCATAIGLAIYLAPIMIEKVKIGIPQDINRERVIKGIATLGALSLVYFGLKNAVIYDPRDFSPTAVPILIKWIYVIGPLLVVLALGASIVLRRREALLIFIFSTALWASTYNGGWAYSDVSILRRINTFYYESAALLNEVPGDEITLYVNGFDEFRKADRLRIVYGIIFNEKFDYSDELHHSQQSRDFVYDQMPYIENIGELEVPIRGYLLTDDKAVFETFPEASLYDTLEWRGSPVFVVDLSLVGD